MWEFIVLGEVPGTSLQVSFDTWLIAMVVLGVTAYIARRSGLHRLAVLIAIAGYLYGVRLKQWLGNLRRPTQPVLPMPAGE